MGSVIRVMIIVVGNESVTRNIDEAEYISLHANIFIKGMTPYILLVQSVGAVEYADCASAAV